MENLSNAVKNGPFPASFSENTPDSMSIDLMRLVASIKKWSYCQGNQMEIDQFQVQVNDWLNTAEYKSFLSKLNTDYRTFLDFCDYLIALNLFNQEIQSQYAFIKRLFLWTVDVNFSKKIDATYTRQDIYQMEFYLLLIKCWITVNAHELPNFLWLNTELAEASETRIEYRALTYIFVDQHVYLLMYLHDILHHTNHLQKQAQRQYSALSLASKLSEKGVSVDLAKLCAAATCEGISRYALQREVNQGLSVPVESWTGLWYDQGKMPYSGHIAMHHNVLNFATEQLSLEALILIYCDLCSMHSDESEQQKSFLNREVAKNLERLEDFEMYLLSYGIEVNCINRNSANVKSFVTLETPMYSLVQGAEVTRHFRLLGVKHSIEMMHLFRTESSLNSILERARSENSPHHFRSYIGVFETYYPYLTLRQKQNLLVFLFEALTNPEEDIRENSARLMGRIIATCDVIGDSCPQGSRLFREYFERFVEADVATTPRHRAWIGHSLGAFVRALFRSANENHIPELGTALFNYIKHYSEQIQVRIYLLKVLRYLPIERLSNDQQSEALSIINYLALSTTGKLRLEGLEALHILLPNVRREVSQDLNCDGLFEQHTEIQMPVISSMARRLKQYISSIDDSILNADIEDPSLLYLSNLKTATPAIVKRLQIDLLIELIWQQKVDAFYVAMHFSNLLKVSAYQDVREKAGMALVDIFPLIANEQRNDIVVELLRALEIEGYQFTKYIPPYLGKLINTLQPQEHDEILSDLVYKIKSANNQICILVLATAAACIEDSLTSRNSNTYSTQKMLSILLNGLVHYDNQVNCEAFFQIGVKVFGNSNIPLSGRESLYTKVAKKILSLVTNHDSQNTLSYLNSATAFNHMYRFLRDAHAQGMPLEVIFPQRKAFFPGAFDPFSLAHKASACAIREQGFEVFLAVDEFSWSKRTQPHRVRRDIVKMSIADEMDMYIFPRRCIVNIANALDLQFLKSIFEDHPVYLVVGSDVLTHASAYQVEPSRTELLNTNHIVFERAQGLGNVRDEALLEEVISSFNAQVVRMTLDASIETISSTQIRTYVDENRDISDLTESLVQKYIYEKNLYRREPQFKDTMTVQAVNVEVYEQLSEELLDEVSTALAYEKQSLKDLINQKRYMQATRVLVIRNLHDNNRIEGLTFFHWLRSSDIYSEFNSQHLTDYIRENASGRILIIDAIVSNPLSHLNRIEQALLTETLCYCLAKDYSYAVYRNTFGIENRRVISTLKQNGFVLVNDEKADSIFVVSMISPITLNLDIKSMIKAPYRNAPRMEQAMENARNLLTEALCKFYPGNLVLSFDRTMIYEHLIRIICEANEVSTVPSVPRKLGKAMLVPYGEVFKRWIVPNTVTKSLHTERYFNRKGDGYKVMAYPNYLNLDIQTRTIKSFNRPVILVDDLFDKGHRFKAIRHHFDKHDIKIQTLAIAILSGRGKAWLEMEGISVKAAYFIPRIRVWFNESHLYPMIGGDAIDVHDWSEQNSLSDALWSGSIPSLNLILPYVYPKHIKGVSPQYVSNFSRVCLKNAYDLLKALEDTYLAIHGRNLTMSTLSDVLVSPRHPEKGSTLNYESHVRPSELIAADLGLLDRIQPFYQGDAQ